MNRPAAKVLYPRWLRAVAVVVGLVLLPVAWVAAVNWVLGDQYQGSPVEGLAALATALVIAAGTLGVSWVGHLTDPPRRLSPTEAPTTPVYGWFVRVLIGIVGAAGPLLFIVGGGVLLSDAEWSPAAATAASLLVALAAIIVVAAALMSASDVRRRGRGERPRAARGIAGALLSATRGPLLIATGTVIWAVLLGLAIGVLWPVIEFVEWLHARIGVPLWIGGLIGLVIALAVWHALVGLAFAIYERRPPRIPDSYSYVPPVSFGSRPGDPIRPTEAESIVGRAVSWTVRVNETPYEPPNAAVLSGIWHLLFEFEDGTHLACEVVDINDPDAIADDSAGRIKAYKRIEVVGGLGAEAMAVIDVRGNEFLWAQLDRRWKVEVYSSARVPRSTRIAAARVVIDRLRDIPLAADDEAVEDEFTGGSGSRPHDPLQPGDVEAVTGKPVSHVFRESETSVDPPDKAVSDGFWELRFVLDGRRGGHQVTCRAVRLDGDASLLEAEREGWSALGESEAVDDLGDEAFTCYDARREMETIWARLDTSWTLQIQTTARIDADQRRGLCEAALRRLTAR